MSSVRAARIVDLLRAPALAAALFACGCASSQSIHLGRQAEDAQDWDRAVVEYTKALRAHPDDTNARTSLERAKLRAAEEHFTRGRRYAATERYGDAVIEFQLASELNPTDSRVDEALRDARQRLRTKVVVSRNGRTELESLIDRTRDLPPPGLDLPDGATLPASLVFGSGATARAVLMTIAKFANLNLIFDPAFRDEPLTIDLRNVTLADALKSITASTHTFYHVTAPRTITIAPDTPAKRREYEESVVRTFYLSNADIKEVIDLLRVVVDIRQISPITATNAISIKDTPERIAAAARLIEAIDKARPEVVIDVELLEVARSRLKEYGLQVASPGQPGISGSFDVNKDNLTLENLTHLTQSDVIALGVPGVYYRLLKNDTNTRILANPQLRTSEGIAASAKFGDRVPVPVTTFAPIAAGGINTQPITSYVYENIGVNIDITPRTHHDDEVTLGVKVSLSSISGTGFGGLPTFGNREISTTIRLRDGETNMLAGLIRDEERTSLAGVPGLSDLPLIGRLFAYNHKETQQTDIILTLTPHIVRVLDLKEGDLRPFVLGRDTTGTEIAAPTVPRHRNEVPPDVAPVRPPTPAAQPPAFPQPLQGVPPNFVPGSPVAVPAPPKKPGGGSVVQPVTG
jgi:general secretion pathway protein D